MTVTTTFTISAYHQ